MGRQVGGSAFPTAVGNRVEAAKQVCHCLVIIVVEVGLQDVENLVQAIEL